MFFYVCFSFKNMKNTTDAICACATGPQVVAPRTSPVEHPRCGGGAWEAERHWSDDAAAAEGRAEGRADERRPAATSAT